MDNITGYQWGDDNRFIGTYVFPNNQDKEDIHLPPNTTLIAPPTEYPVGSVPCWNGESWVIKSTVTIQNTEEPILSHAEMMAKIQQERKQSETEALRFQEQIEEELRLKEEQYLEAERLTALEKQAEAEASSGA
jgi:hypothetical protein